MNIRPNKKLLFLLPIFASMGLGGCQSISKAIGVEKTVPDEFRVVTKAPLVVPPEFNLRPPRPGEARPLELRADLQARNAVFGVLTGTTASSGERELIAQMGATNADNRIRAVIDEETGSITHKSEAFANRVMGRPAPSTGEATPLDSEQEAERIRNEQRIVNGATGGKPVSIQQNKPAGFKLPGL